VSSSHDIPLTEDEVRQISCIIEALNQSNFDYLQLELGTLKLSIGRQGVGPSQLPANNVDLRETHPASHSDQYLPLVDSQGTPHEPDRTDLVEITSPMVGRFYSQPEPGANCYVTVGSEVHPDTTVCLVEAMKMFNAVLAKTAGSITEICVQDADLVEYGQVLFYVRPHV